MAGGGGVSNFCFSNWGAFCDNVLTFGCGNETLRFGIVFVGAHYFCGAAVGDSVAEGGHRTALLTGNVFFYSSATVFAIVVGAVPSAVL